MLALLASTSITFAIDIASPFPVWMLVQPVDGDKLQTQVADPHQDSMEGGLIEPAGHHCFALRLVSHRQALKPCFPVPAQMTYHADFVQLGCVHTVSYPEFLATRRDLWPESPGET